MIFNEGDMLSRGGKHISDVFGGRYGDIILSGFLDVSFIPSRGDMTLSEGGLLGGRILSMGGVMH